MHRVSSFGRYTFVKDIEKYPAVKRLFLSDKFQKAAKSTCPTTKTHLDPFQFNFIVQVPGQTVALHVDSPYFYSSTSGHADRFSYPQWFLVSMMFSNLFSSEFIDQVQVVGYLHQWDPSLDSSGGEFVWYNNDTSYESVLPIPLSGTVVDGSKVFHASKIYRGDVKAPTLDKNKETSLRYVGEDIWAVEGDGVNIQNYTTNELRISIVYRVSVFLILSYNSILL